MNGSAPEIQDRIFLVTGGTSGVGKATALGLARLGAKIVIVSRSSERGQAACDEIAAATGNDRGEFLVADLALQSSVRQVAETVKRRYDRLHVLANCGGAVYPERQLTAEGIERMFAVNYLGHFLLTTELLDLLTASRPARVITVLGAPRFLRNPQVNFDDLQLEHHFSGLRALGQAMFARMTFAFELAKRLEGTGVTSNSFHPGPVKSSLGQYFPWYIRLLTPVFDLMSKDECAIAVYLASAREVEKVSGAFFDDRKRIVALPFDEAAGARLWAISETLTASAT